MSTAKSVLEYQSTGVPSTLAPSLVSVTHSVILLQCVRGVIQVINNIMIFCRPYHDSVSNVQSME